MLAALSWSPPAASRQVRACSSVQPCQIRTPVRHVVYPWIATVAQGSTASLDGLYTGNAHSP
jgi:hypothetical protein